VVLLDEIEKAHPDTFNILIQVLEDGRLTDNKGRVANFKNTIIIMTSNIGSEIIRDNFEKINESNSEEIVEKTKNQVFELLKHSVRPEFLNRIDDLIMFKPLSKENIAGIIRIQLNNLLGVLKKQEISFHVTDHCLEYLKNKGYDVQFGARPLKRLIQKQIMDNISIAILEEKVEPNSHIVMDVMDGQVVIRSAGNEKEKVLFAM